jgi:hypothetical protein
MKKCPPGVICIENMSIFFIIIALILIFYFVRQNIIVNNQTSEKIIIKEEKKENNGFGGFGGFGIGWPNLPYSNLPVPRDVLLNPYAPPLSDERYLISTYPGIVPINVSTNVGAVDTSYRQMGILTPISNKNNKDNKDKIIPLMGRPLFTNRDKWQYYTISDQRNSIKLPIVFNGRTCTNEYGCNRLFTGDKVFIEGINQHYKVNIYENDTIKYLPFI